MNKYTTRKRGAGGFFKYSMPILILMLASTTLAGSEFAVEFAVDPQTVSISKPKCEPPSDAQLDNLVETKLKEAAKACPSQPCPQQLGMVFGVATPTGTRTRAYGSDDDPIRNPSGTFEIASLSKLFTSTMVLMMANEGKIKLDTPIAAYLPKASIEGTPSPFFSDPYKGITVRQLLTHTSGLPEEPLGLEESSQRGKDIRNHYAIDNLFNDLRKSKPNHTPGGQYEYSSFGFSILTAMVESVDKKPYSQSLHDRITGPLGMEHTNLSKTANLMPSFTPNGQLDKSQVRYMGGETLLDGSGGIKSTMSDMLKFANTEVGLNKSAPSNLLRAMQDTQKFQCTLTAGPVSQSSLQANCKNPDWNNKLVAKSVAMDWDSKMPNRISHTGSVPGYKSYLILDRNQSSPMAAVAFTNSERPDAGAMFRSAEGIVNLYKFCQTTAP